MTDDHLYEIPGRAALRIVAAILHDLRHRITKLATQPDRRRGGRAIAGLADKSRGRLDNAARLADDARRLEAWAGHNSPHKLQAVDAAVFGYLCAWALGQMEAAAALRDEWRDLGRAEEIPNDLLGAVRVIFGIAD